MPFVADRFKALSEPAPLRQLRALQHGEQTVNQLVVGTGLGQANTSKHLRVLHANGFVKRRKHGLFVHYTLADRQILNLCELMSRRVNDHATGGGHAKGFEEIGRVDDSDEVGEVRMQIEFSGAASDARNTILIVGFMAEHTLGRRILEQRRVLKIFGEEVELAAQVAVLNGYSAHADRTELHAWLSAVRSGARPKGGITRTCTAYTVKRRHRRHLPSSFGAIASR